MIRWILIPITLCIIVGFSGLSKAEEKNAENQPTTETLVVTEEDKEIIEIIEILSMMDVLKDMELTRELDLFMEEDTNEKED
jgi:hypothetical protein